MIRNQKISKWISSALAALVLLSSLNFMIDLHYCKGELKSFGLIGKAPNCHEMAAAAICPHHQVIQSDLAEVCGESDSNCCHNQSMFVDADIEKQQVNIDVLDINLQQFVAAYVLAISNSEIIAAPKLRSFAHYKPPLISKDIPVLFESFLI